MSATSLPRRIGIVGLGLIGGSVARALKRVDDPPVIVASSLDPDDLSRALEEGVADEIHDDPGMVASEVGLVIYGTPLEETLKLLRIHRDRWSANAVITDVSGLKEPVLRRVREIGEAERYVGSHPMAGSEERGYVASRADLFRDAVVYLVRGDAEEPAAERVETLWTAVGARPAWREAATHDEEIVWTSHLPQLVSNAVAAVLAREGVDPGALGTGGRDVTRLAASPPELWGELLRRMPASERRALGAVARELERLAELVAGDRRDELAGYMEATRRWSRGGDQVP